VICLFVDFSSCTALVVWSLARVFRLSKSCSFLAMTTRAEAQCHRHAWYVSRAVHRKRLPFGYGESIDTRHYSHACRQASRPCATHACNPTLAPHTHTLAFSIQQPCQPVPVATSVHTHQGSPPRGSHTCSLPCPTLTIYRQRATSLYRHVHSTRPLFPLAVFRSEVCGR